MRTRRPAKRRSLRTASARAPCSFGPPPPPPPPSPAAASSAASASASASRQPAQRGDGRRDEREVQVAPRDPAQSHAAASLAAEVPVAGRLDPAARYRQPCDRRERCRLRQGHERLPRDLPGPGMPSQKASVTMAPGSACAIGSARTRRRMRKTRHASRSPPLHVDVECRVVARTAAHAATRRRGARRRHNRQQAYRDALAALGVAEHLEDLLQPLEVGDVLVVADEGVLAQQSDQHLIEVAAALAPSELTTAAPSARSSPVRTTRRRPAGVRERRPPYAPKARLELLRRWRGGGGSSGGGGGGGSGDRGRGRHRGARHARLLHHRMSLPGGEAAARRQGGYHAALPSMGGSTNTRPRSCGSEFR